MASSPSIQFLTRKEINIEKWNECIDNAPNGLVYAYSYYLDAMCNNWDAIILNNYEAVMPLPWRKKYGLRYVHQVAFIQRLGIFGNNFFGTIDLIYKEAGKHFSFLHYNISEQVAIPKINLKKKQNFIIDLDNPYQKIKSSFDTDCIRNIKKAEERGCSFTNEISPDNVIHNFRAAYGLKNSNLKDDDYQRFINLLKEAKNRNTVDLSGVKNQDGLVIYSAAIFKDNKRLYYILGAPTDEGRQKRATYFFIDHLIKLNAEKNLLFDFEGSDIPSVEAFYKKFGPQTEFYYELKTRPHLQLLRFF